MKKIKRTSTILSFAMAITFSFTYKGLTTYHESLQTSYSYRANGFGPCIPLSFLPEGCIDNGGYVVCTFFINGIDADGYYSQSTGMCAIPLKRWY